MDGQENVGREDEEEEEEEEKRVYYARDIASGYGRQIVNDGSRRASAM